MSFGKQLKQARKIKRLTQKDLAGKIGAAHNSISNWENDQNMPDHKTIQKLCVVLGVQLDYFFPMPEIEVEIPSPSKPVINTVRIAGRDGTYEIREISDDQMHALLAVLQQMPNVPKDLK